MYMCAYCVHTLYTVWPEIIMQIKFDKIARKLYFKNFIFFHVQKINIDRYLFYG